MAETLIPLPAPLTDSGMPLTQAVSQRRSVRAYGPGDLSLAQVSQLLWAAQGITSQDGLRSAPSAGALFPLEIHLAIGAVKDVNSGIYHYHPAQHCLQRIHAADVRAALSAAAFNQSWLRDAAAVLALSAVYDLTIDKYGQRGVRYVHMEVGHVAQNVLLQATALGLHSVIVGAFDDSEVQQTLTLPADCAPLCLIPLGL